MIYIVDIDNTICYTTQSDYINSKPFYDRIAKINQLYDDGHIIIYWTARGATSGKDWTSLTVSQLDLWGCKRHSVMMGKPHYDHWIDDKCINSENFFS